MSTAAPLLGLLARIVRAPRGAVVAAFAILSAVILFA